MTRRGAAPVSVAPFLSVLAVAALVMGVLVSALLPLGFFLGVPYAGLLDTGQAAPQRWALAGALGVGLAALVGRNMRWAWLAAGGIVLSVGVFCTVAGTGMPWRGVSFLAFWLTAVGGTLGAVKARRWRLTVVGAGVTALLWATMTSHMSPPPARRVSAGVMTALPLFWAEGRSSEALLENARDEAFVGASTLDLRPVDRLDAETLAPVKRLLLAQPRLLAPTEMVALDAWVRAGGRAVILADPLLLWPSDLPLGYALRPPLTSLLDPLLAHWGLELTPADKGTRRLLLPGGQALIVAGASQFSSRTSQCKLLERGLMAVCAIGRGRVRLIADADMVDDRLWLARPDSFRTRAALSADTIALIDGWLLDPAADPAPVSINRVRGEASLIAGLRWALLGGSIWAGMGGYWFARRERMGKAGRESGMGRNWQGDIPENRNIDGTSRGRET